MLFRSDVTPARVAAMARKLGVRTPLDVNGSYVPAMGLGSIAVSPLDMASAYATLAAGGRVAVVRDLDAHGVLTMLRA